MIKTKAEDQSKCRRSKHKQRDQNRGRYLRSKQRQGDQNKVKEIKPKSRRSNKGDQRRHSAYLACEVGRRSGSQARPDIWPAAPATQSLTEHFPLRQTTLPAKTILVQAALVLFYPFSRAFFIRVSFRDLFFLIFLAGEKVCTTELDNNQPEMQEQMMIHWRLNGCQMWSKRKYERFPDQRAA